MQLREEERQTHQQHLDKEVGKQRREYELKLAEQQAASMQQIAEEQRKDFEARTHDTFWYEAQIEMQIKNAMLAHIPQQ